MAQARIFPYRKVSAEGMVKSSKWKSSADGILDSGCIKSWDPNGALSFSVDISFNPADILVECRLPDDVVLGVCLAWQCQATELRGGGPRCEVKNDSKKFSETMSLDVAGGEVSDEIILRKRIVVVRYSGEVPAFAPMVGAVIWEEEECFVLGESAALFPVGTADFSRCSIAPPGACWALEWNSEAPLANFKQSVRFYVNRNSKSAYEAITAQKPNAQQKAIRSVARFEAARALLTGMLACEEYVSDWDNYPAGSVGATVTAIIRRHFPSDDAEGLRNWMTSRPEYFQGLLQQQFGLLADL